MKRRVLGKRARTHDTNKLKMKKKARSSQKKPMGAVEIETTAYGFPLKDEPLIFLTDDDSEEEYLRPVSPEVVDLRDRYPPRRDWGRIITDPPVCSDHKKKIQSEPDSHDSDWVLRVMELNETEDPDMEDGSPLSHAIEGKPEVKLTLEV